MKLKKSTILFCIILIQAPGSLFSSEPKGISARFRSALTAVVRIETTHFSYSYSSPWKPPVLRRSSGTGFIIDGNRILTNAHVVSHANTIRVKRVNKASDFNATVLYIAHDCDLAILSVGDKAFFEGSIPMVIGNPPELNSPVEVIGFPIGGRNVSITRGIVSRRGMDRYYHSFIDWHKVIQVDAAINPGNSGGPALQKGKVIGVAFQVHRRGQNLGYLIPPEVIRKFLNDINDGRYDGYIDFGLMAIKTTNPILRKAHGLDRITNNPTGTMSRANSGILVYNVIPGSSAEGYIKPNDILLSVMGRSVSHTGDVEIDGEMQSYSEIIDNVKPGSTITAEIWRNRKQLRLSFPARKTNIFNFQRRNYEGRPPYFVLAGLVFQPLNADLHMTFRKEWSNSGQTEILYRYRYFLSRKIYNQIAEDVILIRKLGDIVNLYSDRYIFGIVESVNGKKIKSFRHFVHLTIQALHSATYLALRFRGNQIPLVFRSVDIKKSTSRIMKKYGIRRPLRLESSTGHK